MRVMLRRGLNAPIVIEDVDQVAVLSDKDIPVMVGYHADEDNIVAAHAAEEDFKQHIARFNGIVKDAKYIIEKVS